MVLEFSEDVAHRRGADFDPWLSSQTPRRHWRAFGDVVLDQEFEHSLGAHIQNIVASLSHRDYKINAALE
jgi:hypothetical protein